MGVKAVFFDIDGTLLTDSRTVSRSTVKAINALKEQGIIVGLATGRSPRFLLQYMASLGLDVAIAYNGQYIFSRDDILFTQALALSDLNEMIAYSEKYKRDLSFGTGTDFVGSSIMSFGSGNLGYKISRMVPDAWAGLVTFLFNRVIRLFKPQKPINLQAIIEQPIYQMMMLMTEVESRRIQLKYPHLTLTRSSPYAVDIISKGMSKLKGIEIVGEKLGFNRDEVMAFGDSRNDMEMLCGVRYSVAMGNAKKQVKKVASHVTDTNNKDGIAKAVQYFQEIGECSNVSK